MAPIRRYLRITKHSVLEVRIYLDRPADAESWLLRRDNPALPRIIQAVRPLVLPKLREENERAKGRGGAKSKKGVKDVVVEDDFEVSIFLTEHSSRHSVLTKQKVFEHKPRIKSNSGKLTGWLTTEPIVINEDISEPIAPREDDEDEVVDLAQIPEQVGEKDDKDELSANEDDVENEAKKLRLNTSYEGFSIYSRILCLVVKRKGVRQQSQPISSQQMLENWVSTQAAAEPGDDDEG
ncbi:hypothetical protein K458DRAFT_420830 [Lentithecium fluviatile CBS 122367]|uniref:Uncharacterized protein n=1 Tax=Lentithecium fluviatile CBS 122367 TaxID=1168545 RepID=A0A6G1ISU6_9PLEO|nr:hypothetical protein K458DRAFT_420830 [Lentithecium fluviatile CBS 122367]